MRSWSIAGVSLILTGMVFAQEQGTLRIAVSLSDATQTTIPVAGYTLLISDDPPTREPRRIRTNADGTVVVALRPGSYTVESDRPAALGGKGYQWTQIVEVVAGRDNTLTLNAKNAELVAASDSAPPSARSVALDHIASVRKWEPSVVAVWSPTARATGFVVDQAGLIATDRQSIASATTVEVQLSPTIKLNARVVVADPARPVAIVGIAAAAVGGISALPLQCPPEAAAGVDDGDEIVAILGYLIRQAVEKRGEEYLTYPQRALFDKIGIRRQVLEPDPWGNFLLSGYDYGTARNWARLGLLYLRDGVWNGQRLLPEGFTKFVSTPAPAWPRPEYGGQFWINGVGQWNLPRDAYYMSGAGGQHTFVVPSHDLVVVRMGHQRGSSVGSKLLNQSLSAIVAAVEAAR